MTDWQWGLVFVAQLTLYQFFLWYGIKGAWALVLRLFNR